LSKPESRGVRCKPLYTRGAASEQLGMRPKVWMLAVAGLWLWALVPEGSAAGSGTTRARDRYVIDVWETDDGLPQNSVFSVIQTREGYLWFGTLNGLVRFDGMRFTVFDESNTPGLNSSRIVSLFEDRHGHLWIGTQSAGLAVIREGQVTSVGIGQGGSDRRLVSACDDPSGAVWLYTADGQLWRYENDRFSVFPFGLDRPSACRSVIAEASGQVWVGTDWRLAALAPTAGRSSFDLRLAEEVSVGRLDRLLASREGGYWRMADGRVQKWRGNGLERDWGGYPWGAAPVTAACEDRQGNLLVGTLGVGVYWYGAEGRPTWLSTAQGLSSDAILSLCMDREGDLWVGTDGGGLNRVKRQVFAVVNEAQGLAADVVQSICADDRGGLWVGSNGGGLKPGLTYLQGERVERFGPGEGLVNSHVWAVLVDRGQGVWVGTAGGGLFQWGAGRFQPAPGTEALPRFVLALHEDREGRLWVGTRNGLARYADSVWRLFTAADGLTADEVHALAEDPGAGLWVGTVGGGLNLLHDGRFRAFRKADGLPSEDISALLVDGEGVLWVGTFGSGLARRQGDRWTHYTTREGLVSNSIHYLIEDGQGALWIGSNAGLMRVLKRELNELARGAVPLVSCRAYGRPDGLPTRECTRGSQPAACLSSDGTLWFPTAKGLVAVDPTQLNPNTNPPPVIIETVLIDGRPQSTNQLRPDWPQPLIVPAGKERLEIRYTSLNLSAPDRGRFRYRLEGHETTWVEAGSSRVAWYSKLRPGPYRFHVTACNEDGVWNPTGSSLALIVRPPLWLTWWFLSVSAVCLLGLITATVHWVSTQKLQRQLERVRHEEALDKERARIARDIHDQLGANLTQVALLGELIESDKDCPEEVESHARQIAQTARDTTRGLDEIVWAVNPSNDTLDGLLTYACKYAQEYLTLAGVSYRVDMPSQLPGAVLSPDVRHNVFLAFKEAITNVVRHAAAPAAWVRLRLEPASFTLEIQDNGRGVAGLDPSTLQTRNGLRNMRKRMTDLGGQFDIGPAPEGGTLVRLTVPVRSP